jgi:hypothetical protein
MIVAICSFVRTFFHRPHLDLAEERLHPGRTLAKATSGHRPLSLSRFFAVTSMSNRYH